MPRLIQFPAGLRVTARAPLTGPRSVSSSSSESFTGFTQTIASPYGAWRWQFTFAPMHKDEARRYRGFITALHGGANATRVTFRDPDVMSHAQAGLSVSQSQIHRGIPWSNSMPWSNGRNWAIGYPHVGVTAAASKGTDTVTLANQFWRASLGVGDQIGFGPFYFGLHVVTEVKGGGAFRIWPPLRKDIASGSYATLTPVMVMRLESESSAPIGRGISTMEAPTITLAEVLDEDVRAFYTG